MKKSNLKAELYKLNELPRDWTLEGDAAQWTQAVEELKASDEEILKKYKPAEMAAQIARQMEGAKVKKEEKILPFSRKFNTRILIPAAAALLIIAFMLPLTLKSRNDSVLEMTRVKGAGIPELRVYRKTGKDSESLSSNSAAVEYDLLQLAYQVSGPTFGVILSVDGRGVVTKHFPESGDQSPRLETGGEQFLPFSYELDDAPDFETFYLITSDKPFSTEAVMDATASAARSSDEVLDIPQLIKKINRETSGKIRQYAVPIRKDGNHE
ncbi:hypothetical protein [Oceanispirochaeta sp.]|jgi:hypothetical protein|uniref:hypothetical protein n=1 Tax=Oceanispirochaeta sp. TaxID=2035350 RepID=UPI00262E462C|nr:hypothetical protein [Oceanispirochaeta sp.]MDA3958090.1 hypothetical protein [Oceanispirochaeta sp.]